MNKEKQVSRVGGFFWHTTKAESYRKSERNTVKTFCEMEKTGEMCYNMYHQ